MLSLKLAKWNLLKIGTVFRNEWDSKLLRPTHIGPWIIFSNNVKGNVRVLSLKLAKWNLLKIGTVFRNEWDSKLLRGGTL